METEPTFCIKLDLKQKDLCKKKYNKVGKGWYEYERC